MLLPDVIEGELPDARALQDMLESTVAGVQLRKLPASPFDSKTFRKLAACYAGSPEAPFGTARIDLYHQICDLFGVLRGLPGNESLKAYELKDSFLGGQEADLVMLLASHEGVSQESLAHDVLRCSKNAVGERRARMKDGIRIGGMCIRAEFGYRGDFRSSVHPVSLPLNLSEAYVLFDALAEYAGDRSDQDPHAQAAKRIAGMVKSQMSGYAKEKLEPRLQEMGFGDLPDVPPCFTFDVSEPGSLGDAEEANPQNWLYFMKSGSLACVELVDGEQIRGVVLPRAKIPAFLRDHGVVLKDKRPCCVILREDGGFSVIPWSDVVDIHS